MSVLSVPLSPALAKIIDGLVNDGVATNKADAARKVIEFYAEEQAIQAVLQAEREINEGKVFYGDLDELITLNYETLSRSVILNLFQNLSSNVRG